MFPLFAKQFPASADELRERMNDSLRRAFLTDVDPVSLSAPAFPNVDELKITLDGARLRSDPPRPDFATHGSDEQLSIRVLAMSGRNVDVGGALVDLALNARGVALDSARTRDGEIVLVPRAAESGQVEVGISKAGLERIITDFAKREAGKHGIKVENVALTVQQRGGRSLDAEARIRAGKFFVAATIRVVAKLDIDDDLNATLSDVRCEGEGMVANVACGVLSPHLQRVNGRRFALVALPLGDVRLRDIQITAGERISVRAEFAAAA